MTWILKDGEQDGIFPGIGLVRSGEPVTAYTPEQEELLRADARFKQHRPPANAEPVTEGGAVKDKPAKAAKE